MSAPAALTSSATPLAELIYVELVGRAFLRVENAAVIKPEPEVLAKLSLALAAAFRKADKVDKAAAGPQNVGYDVQLADITKWEK
jgi:hypothetical protein